MQDTNLRQINQPIGPPPRRSGLLIASVAVLVLAVAGGIWFLANRDSEPEESATAPTTTIAATTTTPTPEAATPTTQAPPAAEAPTAPEAPAEQAWPSPRFLESAAFDEQSGVLVSFGGTKEEIGLGDTWIFDPAAETWTEANPSPAPPLRYAAAAAYDPGLDRIVLFGGAADNSFVWDDLWLYDSDTSTWEKAEPEGPKPSPTVYASMVYVDSLGGMLMYGGSGSPWLGVGPFYGAWFLDTTTMTWTEIVTEGPGGRLLHGLAYDPVADRVVLSGGRNTATAVWFFDPSSMTWTRAQTQPDLGPSPTVYDPASGSIIGPGLAYSVATDGWSEIPWGEEIDAGHIVLDPARNVLLILGPDIGLDISETTLWEYDLGAQSWRLIGPEPD